MKEKEHTSSGASCADPFVLCPLHGAHEQFVETAGSYEGWITGHEGPYEDTLLGIIERQERYAQSLHDCIGMFPNTDNVLQQIKKSSCRIMLEVTSTSASSGIQIAMASSRVSCNNNCIRIGIVIVMLLKLCCIGPQQGQRILQSALLLLWQGHGTPVLQGGVRQQGNGIDTATSTSTNSVVC